MMETENKASEETEKVVFEVGAVGVDTVRNFGAYRMPESISIWVYEGGQIVVETSGTVTLADAVQISQRCRDVSNRISPVRPWLSDYVLRPESSLVFAGSSRSKSGVSRLGYVRPPDYYHLKIYAGGEVRILTGGKAEVVQVARIVAYCEKAGFSPISER